MASELSFDTWTQIAILISITAGIFSLFTHHMNFEQILKFLLNYCDFCNSELSCIVVLFGAHRLC